MNSHENACAIASTARADERAENEIRVHDEHDFVLFSQSSYGRWWSRGSFDLHLQKLQDSYHRLPLDPYMSDGGKYRFRRFGRFALPVAEASLIPLAPGAFHQSKQINTLNGGIDRIFAPVEADTMTNPLLHAIITYQCQRLPAEMTSTPWLINIHQIRIVSHPGEKGKPTPEGMHQDGHHFVAQVMLQRTNALGAKSFLYDENKARIFETTLRQPLETILLDDQRLYHEVTPLLSADGESPAVRDMLLIDFNPQA